MGDGTSGQQQQARIYFTAVLTKELSASGQAAGFSPRKAEFDSP